jgi:steroid delta-isomerase-like uncharacterized protein
MGMTSAAEALLGAYNEHDLAAVAACYRDDATHVDVASGRPKVGPDAIAGGLGYLLTAFPDAAWHAEAAVEQGDVTAVRYRLTGTLQSAFGGFEPHGQALDLPGVLWLELSAGAIAHSVDFWDSGSFTRQMRTNHSAIPSAAAKEKS